MLKLKTKRRGTVSWMKRGTMNRRSIAEGSWRNDREAGAAEQRLSIHQGDSTGPHGGVQKESAVRQGKGDVEEEQHELAAAQWGLQSDTGETGWAGHYGMHIQEMNISPMIHNSEGRPRRSLRPRAQHKRYAQFKWSGERIWGLCREGELCLFRWTRWRTDSALRRTQAEEHRDCHEPADREGRCCSLCLPIRWKLPELWVNE